MTADQFRAIVLAHPGVEEGAHMGHPDFRANGRIFASLLDSEKTAMVKVSPGEQAVLLGEHPGLFRPAAGAWGRQGCTLITLAPVTANAVRPAVLLAWEQAMRRPPARTRKRR